MRGDMIITVSSTPAYSEVRSIMSINMCDDVDRNLHVYLRGENRLDENGVELTVSATPEGLRMFDGIQDVSIKRL